MLAAAVMALSACGEPAKTPDEAANTASNASMGNTPSLPQEAAQVETTNTASTDNDRDIPTIIPAEFHGRWGLAKNDCPGGATGGQGLLTITGDSLKFYESVGIATKLTTVAPREITGMFDFTGEGQSWQNAITLSLDANGSSLIRKQADAPETYRYTKCAG